MRCGPLCVKEHLHAADVDDLSLIRHKGAEASGEALAANHVRDPGAPPCDEACLLLNGDSSTTETGPDP
jgi:hypothetical protein